MPGLKIRNIVLFGAGNLAVNLALAIRKAGFTILQVYNRTETHGIQLANKVGATYINDLSRLDLHADLYIISVSDSAIKSLAGKIRVKDKLIIHTSGSMDIDILQKSSSNMGVFHSPQTFSKTRPVNFTDLHVDIQANNKESEKLLVEFAGMLCKNVHIVTAEQRRIIHIAAVFSGNFTNFMYSVAEDILTANDLPFDLMRPIIKKTSENSGLKDPFSRQTGPAVREDYEVLEKHMKALSQYPDYRSMYDLISKNIIKHKKLHE
jgi:predicted short-subunit dehydrogenase-like oxidoreductase (DUF2520 family)